ncbi:hypothetical protein KQH62_05535 [bacterium]|nr:hypothetical protein [bacterium]
MDIKSAQFEMRSAFLGGFAGQLVSGIIWLIAAAISLFVSPLYGMGVLFFGSMLIFPLTQTLIRAMGRPGKTSDENGLWPLGAQTAFTVPINFLLVGAATLYRQEWFFPAAMIVVGSHYLPFITLYGMKMFGILAGLMIVGGLGLALYGPAVFSLGGWVTGGLLILFAFVGRGRVIREEGEAA